MFSKHILIGHLGSDPEMRYTPQGQGVCSFRMAVSRRWGEGKEETTWYKVATWGKLAETCSQYLQKGRLVLVEGDRLKVDAYANREGQPAASMELTAQTVKFIGGNRDGGGAPGGNQGGSAGSAPDYDGYNSNSDEIPF